MRGRTAAKLFFYSATSLLVVGCLGKPDGTTQSVLNGSGQTTDLSAKDTARPGPKGNGDSYFGDDGLLQAKVKSVFTKVESTLATLEDTLPSDPVLANLTQDCTGIPQLECPDFLAVPAALRTAAAGLFLELAHEYLSNYKAKITFGFRNSLSQSHSEAGDDLLAGVVKGSEQILFLAGPIDSLNLNRPDDFRRLFSRLVHELLHIAVLDSVGQVLDHSGDLPPFIGADGKTLAIRLISQIARKHYVRSFVSPPSLEVSASLLTVQIPVNPHFQVEQSSSPFSFSVSTEGSNTITVATSPGVEVSGGVKPPAGESYRYSVRLSALGNPWIRIVSTDQETGLRSQKDTLFQANGVKPTSHPIYRSRKVEGSRMRTLYSLNTAEPASAGFSLDGQVFELFDSPTTHCRRAIFRYMDGAKIQTGSVVLGPNDPAPAQTLGYACNGAFPGTRGRHVEYTWVDGSEAFAVELDGGGSSVVIPTAFLGYFP